jgi:hypothetical protein
MDLDARRAAGMYPVARGLAGGIYVADHKKWERRSSSISESSPKPFKYLALRKMSVIKKLNNR